MKDPLSWRLHVGLFVCMKQKVEQRHMCACALMLQLATVHVCIHADLFMHELYSTYCSNDCVYVVYLHIPQE